MSLERNIRIPAEGGRHLVDSRQSRRAADIGTVTKPPVAHEANLIGMPQCHVIRQRFVFAEFAVPLKRQQRKNSVNPVPFVYALDPFQHFLCATYIDRHVLRNRRRAQRGPGAHQPLKSLEIRLMILFCGRKLEPAIRKETHGLKQYCVCIPDHISWRFHILAEAKLHKLL